MRSKKEKNENEENTPIFIPALVEWPEKFAGVLVA
jgi:hypothetical protein